MKTEPTIEAQVANAMMELGEKVTKELFAVIARDPKFQSFVAENYYILDVGEMHYQLRRMKTDEVLLSWRETVEFTVE